MTHFSKYSKHQPIEWDDTFIERYDGNNGIVLKHKGPGVNNEVIAYIHGEDVGVTKDDLSDVPIERATPIFKAMLDGYNKAYRAAHAAGIEHAQKMMQTALGAKW